MFGHLKICCFCVCPGFFCFRFRCLVLLLSFWFRSFVCLFACCGIRGNYYILITHAFAATAQLQRCRRQGKAEQTGKNGPKYNRKNVNENGVKNQFHGFYIPVYLL